MLYKFIFMYLLTPSYGVMNCWYHHCQTNFRCKTCVYEYHNMIPPVAGLSALQTKARNMECLTTFMLQRKLHSRIPKQVKTNSLTINLAGSNQVESLSRSGIDLTRLKYLIFTAKGRGTFRIDLRLSGTHKTKLELEFNCFTCVNSTLIIKQFFGTRFMSQRRSNYKNVRDEKWLAWNNKGDISFGEGTETGTQTIFIRRVSDWKHLTDITFRKGPMTNMEIVVDLRPPMRGGINPLT